MRSLTPFTLRRTFVFLAATGLVTLLPAPGVLGQPKGNLAPERLAKLFDARTIGIEARLQGEYAGKLADQKLAAQIVARGDQHFHALLFPGGLPGDGWDGKSYVFVDNSALADNKVTFRSPAGAAEPFALVVSEAGIEGSKADQKFSLGKVERKSPTLGQAPPRRAIVLFSGKDLSEWQNPDKLEASITPTLYEGHLLAGAETRRNFKDISLHQEFMHGFEPENIPWRRADSGVYLQQRYEVAIGDSFGFDFDMTGTAGPVAPSFFAARLLKGEKFSVFNGAKSTTPPVVCGSIFRSSAKVPNHCFPPLAWQTLDIEFRAPRFDESGKKISKAVVSTKLNGLEVAHRQEVNGPTAHGAKGEVAEAPLWLQGYQRTVLYRNVWLIETPH